VSIWFLARFFLVTNVCDPRQIHRAAQHPVDLDMAQAHAVEARILLDLRIGAAFTRMQTLTLQTRLAQFRENREVVSYGSFITELFVLS
jgi:DNA topoisomerase IA